MADVLLGVLQIWRVCIVAEFFLNISYIFGVSLLTSKQFNLIKVFLMHLNQHVPAAMESSNFLFVFAFLGH